MRHEIRDKDSLFFTLEVVIGGTPVTGLSPTVAISSVSNNEYWNKIGAVWQGPYVANSMVEVDATNLPGVYFFDASAAYAGDTSSADRGYLVKKMESTHSILEYTFAVVSDAMEVSTPATVDANVVEYLGVAASSSVAGKPDVNVDTWKAAAVTLSTGNLPNINVARYADSLAAASLNGMPDVNVKAWADDTTGIAVSVTNKLPNINVHSYANVPASSTVPGKPDVNVTNYLTNVALSSVDGMPDVNVMDWNGDTLSSRHANISASSTPETGMGTTTGEGFPHIAVAAWQNDLGGPQPDQPIYVRHSPGCAGLSGELLPALTVEGWGGDSAAKISVGPTNKFPRITVKAWEGTGYDQLNTGASLGNDDIAVAYSLDTDPYGNNVVRPDMRANIIANDAIDEEAFKTDAISARVIADNAIDEGSIAIDSVTYEEISDGAAEKISDAIWNADIFKTLYRPHLGSTAPAVDGSMAHAMIVQYLSQNMIHGGTSALPGGESSPVHSCKTDANGKFYSNRLHANPLTTPEFASYIDRSVVIVKNFEFSMGSSGMEPTISWNGVQVHLGRIAGIGEDGSGQYFQINLVDEDETAPVFKATKDIIIIKAETDSTMHEVAHEVWEEEVADHSTKHTFGMFNRIMAGLSQYNHRIADALYDESGRLTACRLVVYPSSLDAKNETNALTTIVLASEYNEKQNMTELLAREEGIDVDPD